MNKNDLDYELSMLEENFRSLKEKVYTYMNTIKDSNELVKKITDNGVIEEFNSIYKKYELLDDRVAETFKTFSDGGVVIASRIKWQIRMKTNFKEFTEKITSIRTIPTVEHLADPSKIC